MYLTSQGSSSLVRSSWSESSVFGDQPGARASKQLSFMLFRPGPSFLRSSFAGRAEHRRTLLRSARQGQSDTKLAGASGEEESQHLRCPFPRPRRQTHACIGPCPGAPALWTVSRCCLGLIHRTQNRRRQKDRIEWSDDSIQQPDRAGPKSPPRSRGEGPLLLLPSQRQE